ncbi:hypothetical protein E2L07_16135 [Halalkalibacterium halodurans]|uniref:hypothetical protein n=1 Tax=Halalkalibacterium halodurans TaxID=86665 RepID=UPI0010680D87|nr:hypothetical protein [Halalkalibacterium halodurans]TES50320.1 hypothetical protein E2L07_16135 [Halalkalibacterium halodurans]
MIYTIEEVMQSDKEIRTSKDIPIGAITQKGIIDLGENILDYDIDFFVPIDGINGIEFEPWYRRKKGVS